MMENGSFDRLKADKFSSFCDVDCETCIAGLGCCAFLEPVYCPVADDNVPVYYCAEANHVCENCSLFSGVLEEKSFDWMMENG